MNFDVDPATVTKSPFFIGLLGGIVALRGVPGAGWKSRAFNLFCAMLISGYTSPAVAAFFGAETEANRNVAAFVVGLFGLNITAAIVVWISEAKLSDILPFTKKG
jgi:hypothetical protein